VEFDALTEADVVARVRSHWADGVGGAITTLNVDSLRMATHDEDLARLFSSTSTVVADGMPLIWSSRLAGQALPQRVTGSSLIFSLSAAAADDGRSVYLLGGPPGVADAAARRLEERFPEVRIAGVASPPMGFDQSEAGVVEVAEKLCAADPDVVFVGLGAPKQELIIARLQVVHPRAWYLGCGAAIAMTAGQFPRAPRILQDAGLEWAFRLALEPRRLAGRYLLRDAPFALGLLGRAIVRRFSAHGQPGDAEQPHRDRAA
jgi:N-acetylglucosaminyldiphosphoundecaprenol N-acetyl-beta-D-mannosaminyltransferase